MSIGNTDSSNKALMRRAFDALNRRDLDECVQLLEPDFIMNIAGVLIEMRGADTWRKGVEYLYAAFPDIAFHVEDLLAEEDRVAVRLRLTGTHRGEFQGIPASGREVAYASNEIYRFTNGRIAEEWICSDTLSLMTQVGALPSET